MKYDEDLVLIAFGRMRCLGWDLAIMHPTCDTVEFEFQYRCKCGPLDFTFRDIVLTGRMVTYLDLFDLRWKMMMAKMEFERVYQTEMLFNLPCIGNSFYDPVTGLWNNRY